MRPEWCQYVCEDHDGKVVILESGAFQGATAFCWAEERGVEFLHEGEVPEATLWLVRDRQAHPLARRVGGRVSRIPQEFVEVKIEEKGVYVKEDSVGIQPTDGFEILPTGVPCLPGENPGIILVEV